MKKYMLLLTILAACGYNVSMQAWSWMPSRSFWMKTGIGTALVATGYVVYKFCKKKYTSLASNSACKHKEYLASGRTGEQTTSVEHMNQSFQEKSADLQSSCSEVVFSDFDTSSSVGSAQYGFEQQKKMLEFCIAFQNFSKQSQDEYVRIFNRWSVNDQKKFLAGIKKFLGVVCDEQFYKNIKAYMPANYTMRYKKYSDYVSKIVNQIYDFFNNRKKMMRKKCSTREQERNTWFAFYSAIAR